ncbi:hypothetical protein F5146DRAFT_416112 [Armillaria mellea]|nr:hypothetical protein F5146DRAFT_416112 [Armillaria mellea]
MSEPAHVIYTKLLLQSGHGYPLWIPEPDPNLPDEYRNKGVSVGDLGILTDDGGFDFLFNVCAEGNTPVNRGRVPPQFQHLRIPSGHAIRETPYIHSRNASITSAHVSKTTITVEGSAEMTSFVTGGGGFEFSTSKAEAAILMLPEGGNRYNTRHRALFEAYATENGLSWYEYVNSLQHLAQSARNGSLYLVTGCDKARSWMTAAATCPSKSRTISAKFAIGPTIEGRISLHSSWSTPRIGDGARVHPNYPDPMPEHDNQCVFMRGLTITLKENIFKQILHVLVKADDKPSAVAAPFRPRSPYFPRRGKTTGTPNLGILLSTGPVDKFDIPEHLVSMILEPALVLSANQISRVRQTKTLNPC